MNKPTDFNDLAKIRGKGKKAIAEAVAQALPPAVAAATTDPEQWPDVVLPGENRTPEISPALPGGWLGDMVHAVAYETQTPPAMAVMLAFAVVATVVQRRWVVAPKAPMGDTYTETLSFWALAAMESGSRKTAVLAALTKPLVEWEERERSSLRRAITHNATERAIALARIKKLTDKAAGEEDAERRKALRQEAETLKDEMPDELHYPRLFTADTTSETLQSMLVRQGERMALLADEPGIFSIMAGQYSGGKAVLDVFLQGHSGSPVRVDRADREAYLAAPALSFGVAIQPGVLFELGENRHFMHSGLLARFLYVLPESNIGRRDVRRSAAIPEAVRQAYGAGIMGLLEGRRMVPEKPKCLDFTEPAMATWLDFAEQIERQQGDGGKFEAIRSWTGKLPGAAARIAGLIELATVGPHADSVSQDAVERAVTLCWLLTDHAIAVFGKMGADDKDAGALAILRWIQANKLSTFTKKKVSDSLSARFGNVEKLDDALKRLNEWGVIRQTRKTPSNGGKGGRPTELSVVNPKVLGG